MVLVNIAESPRVTLIVVALGRTLRLNECITSLVSHESRTSFSIVCVINPISPISPIDPQSAVDAEGLALEAFDIQIVAPDVNLGWAGGLHAGRALAKSDLLVWVQDDMVVLPGWLDALVTAADENPDVGAFGSVRLDTDGVVQLFNGGWAVPDDLLRWSSTDTSQRQRPSGVTRLDWVTSRGLLVRTSVWDEVGGADPSLFPLTYVDLDFSTHVRAHGWGVALVAGATVWHAHNQSAPGLLREYLNDRLTPRVHERWSAVTAALPAGAAAQHPHDCTRDRAEDVEGWVSREATDIVVRFGRWAEQWRRSEFAELASVRAALDESQRDALGARGELDALRTSRSWRITAPFRALRNPAYRDPTS